MMELKWDNEVSLHVLAIGALTYEPGQKSRGRVQKFFEYLLHFAKESSL
jgi:hypothetical protein